MDNLSNEDFSFGLNNNLMGQVNLVRSGRNHENESGSFTLTSGILVHQSHATSVMLTMINSGIDGFARSATLGLSYGQRLNDVSPPMVKETAENWAGGV